MTEHASFLVLLALGAAACGEEVPVTPDAGGVATCSTPAAERLLPLALGASWTYRISEPGLEPVEKHSTVEAYEDVGDRKLGTSAFRVRTEKTAGATVSWQEDRCDGIVRHRERSFSAAGALESDQFYVPGKPRVDETPEHLVLGATWSTSYSEVEVDPVTGGTTTRSKSETWTVEAVDEEVIVPAGTFSCLRVRRIGEDVGQADKRFWFARGVGKVKEEGEQLEELVSFEPGSATSAP